MAKKAFVYDGTQWVDIAQSTTDLTNYANMTTTPISGFRNAIINGGFDIWQRGTSFASSTSSAWTADRWYANRSNGTSSVSRISFTPGELSIPGNGSPDYFLRHAVTIGNDFTEIQQRIENVNTFAGQTVTLSFWAKGTNPGDGSYSARLAQTFGTGGSTTVSTWFNPITITSSWARYSVTTTLPSVAGKTIGAESFVQLVIGQSNSTSTAAWTLDIWGVQLEAGSIATPFEHRPIGTELALCQRYYYRVTPTVDGQWLSGFGTARSTTEVLVPVFLPVTMRTIPTFTGSQTAVADTFNTRIVATTGVITSAQPNIAGLSLGVTGAVQYRPYVMLNNSGQIGTSFMAFDAEL